MSLHTPIEWCDSAVNPTMGCDGCELWLPDAKHCYAGILHDRYGGSSKGYAPTFKDVTMFPGRMEETLRWKDLRGIDRTEKPWLNGLPRIIFVSDMSDALSKAVKFDYLKKEIIDVAWKSPHIYMWLTKRPKRMAEFAEWAGSWPCNLWAGTSVTNQATADTRVPELLKVPAQTRFVSAEPIISPIDLRFSAFNGCDSIQSLEGLHLVIAGGESGGGARPCNLEWIDSIVGQCQAANIAAFVKQLGAHPVMRESGCFVAEFSQAVADAIAKQPIVSLNLKDKKGGDMAEWPVALRVRQFPKT
jgi:protein gp37